MRGCLRSGRAVKIAGGHWFESSTAYHLKSSPPLYEKGRREAGPNGDTPVQNGNLGGAILHAVHGLLGAFDL